MSFAEVLAAAKELTADEQQTLARELALPPDDIPEHLRQFIPQPGKVTEMNWPIEASAENIAALHRVLAEADEQQTLALELALPPDDIPEHLRQFIPPEGTIIPYWKPELTAEGGEQVRQILAEIEQRRSEGQSLI